MGKKGPIKHLKRHKSPEFWPLHRKEKTWAIRTSPGPHKLEESIPGQIAIRDILEYAKTGRETKILFKQGMVVVDGKTRYDEGFPIGVMDVVSFPDANEYYRVLPGHRGNLIFHQINEEEKDFKLSKILNKSTLKKGKIQLNLHDGKNLIISNESDNFQTGEVLKLKIPEMEIMDSIPFEEGVEVIITGGRSKGERGTLIGLGDEPGWKKTANVRTPEGKDIRTLTKYVFPIGEDEPLISVPYETSEKFEVE